jgi:hypothetical protein
VPVGFKDGIARRGTGNLFGPIPTRPGDAGWNKWFLILAGSGVISYGVYNWKKIAEQDRTKALLVFLICLSLIAVGLYNIVMKQ